MPNYQNRGYLSRRVRQAIDRSASRVPSVAATGFPCIDRGMVVLNAGVTHSLPQIPLLSWECLYVVRHSACLSLQVDHTYSPANIEKQLPQIMQFFVSRRQQERRSTEPGARTNSLVENIWTCMCRGAASVPSTWIWSHRCSCDVLREWRRLRCGDPQRDLGTRHNPLVENLHACISCVAGIVFQARMSWDLDVFV